MWDLESPTHISCAHWWWIAQEFIDPPFGVSNRQREQLQRVKTGDTQTHAIFRVMLVQQQGLLDRRRRSIGTNPRASNQLVRARASLKIPSSTSQLCGGPNERARPQRQGFTEFLHAAQATKHAGDEKQRLPDVQFT